MSTLDVFHQEYLARVNEQKLELDTKKQLFFETSVKIDLMTEQENERTEEQITEYIRLIDLKIDLQEQMNRLQKIIDTDHYYTKTSDILFKYYDLLKNGDSSDSSVLLKKNSILKYFAKEDPKENVKQQTEASRSCLLGAYQQLTDANYIAKKNGHAAEALGPGEEKCAFCNSSNIIVMLNEGYQYCDDCHTMENLIIDHNKPSYKDPPKEITYFSYKRINHLNEWLNQIQGKETTDIPEEIYDKILMEIKKQRITNMTDITYDKMKKILKQLKIHKYYEHIPHIINRLNGLPMPNFSPELEEKLRSMFKQIQTPFLKHSPAKRKNFLSYSYVLKKFLQLLEKDEFLIYFQLLKSRDKLASQDKIWKSICEEVGWQFIPSL